MATEYTLVPIEATEAISDNPVLQQKLGELKDKLAGVYMIIGNKNDSRFVVASYFFQEMILFRPETHELGNSYLRMKTTLHRQSKSTHIREEVHAFNARLYKEVAMLTYQRIQEEGAIRLEVALLP